MSRVFERGDKERLSVIECVWQVYGDWVPSFSIKETRPQFCVKVTMDNEEVFEWDSADFRDWEDLKYNSFKKLLNKEVTRGYVINLTTGEARWKSVSPEARERYFAAKKQGENAFVCILAIEGDKKKNSVWSGWEKGERANVVKVEIIGRDEMPIQNVLAALSKMVYTHPARLREKHEPWCVADFIRKGFLDDLTRIFNTISEDDTDDVLAVKLCKLVDHIFQVYGDTGIDFEWVWMDYFHSVKSGSALRTKDIVEFFKERDRKKKEERRGKKKTSTE